ncbi:MAG: hypothetical protein Q8O52_28905 [Sulfuritalea sp.]|nr:hypothetical protein [Sulfuritalea sp.]
MTYHRALYFAVSKCRELIRQGRGPSAAARRAAADFGLDDDDAAMIRELALTAELACIEARLFFRVFSESSG